MYRVVYGLGGAGPSVFQLHGRQNQLRRLEIVKAFSEKPRAACLVCTDVAARGLDLEGIEWVVQLNCPFDVETYIHRVGRTARYTREGNSLLFLLPSEKQFLQRLKEKAIEPKLLGLNPKKMLSITGKLASLLASERDVKHLAHRAMGSYIRSIGLAADKAVFDPEALRPHMQDFATSYGLVACPEDVGQALDAAIASKKQNGPPVSKLQRLKEKICQKKKQEKVQDDDDDAAVATLSKTERRLQRVQALKQQQTDESSDENDDVLVPVTKDDGERHDMPARDNMPPSSEEPTWMLPSAEEQKLRSRMRKEQIRIRSDGTAKVKGFAMLSKFFHAHVARHAMCSCSGSETPRVL